jgi:ATP-dependent helicase HrpA
MTQQKLSQKKIEAQLSHAMLSDRYAVARELRRIRRSRISEEKRRARLAAVEKRLLASIQIRMDRETGRPRPEYIDALPITAKKEEIVSAIRKHPVLIVSGDTGSGKSTQIPKFCLEAGRGVAGIIGCTQPRRIAATSVARRIAEELGEEIGRSVGYKIRFSDQTGAGTYIKLMTDGILLAETQGDPLLTRYDTIIVDEAHERSLNIDFILGILKNLLLRRKDLKLIVTSATIDTEKFSHAFDGAPIIEVSGRMYPVEVRYKTEGVDENDGTYIDLAVDAIDSIVKESPFGDILVFMPTEQDIRETCELIEGRGYRGAAIFPLFARLSGDQQSKVFSKPPGRKIIVATNVAETSLTIPGIRYVVDTGLARISRYSPRTRTTALPVAAISRSSAEQRKGRCGRVENGICIRLYPQEDFEAREMFTPPEILRSNLAEVILRMIALRLGSIETFPFIDRPAPKNIRDGFDLLTELGAIVHSPQEAIGYALTDRGRLMARLPIDPRLSRMLIHAGEEGCLKEIVVVASALSIQDPRDRPAEKRKEADSVHKAFQDPESDFITLLNIWKRYHETLKAEKTISAMKRFCKASFLSYRRMREWRDVHSQIWGILQEAGFTGAARKRKFSPEAAEPFPEGYSAVHRSILSGFLSNIGEKKEGNIYRAAKGGEAMIFPGSSIFNRGKQWIMAAEMVETSRLFARNTANIDNRWLEEIGKDQCRYTYLNPRWSRRRGEVVATEQVSLYGLIIDPGRTVPFGPIDPETASDLFLRDALVRGDVRESLGFLEHNRNLTAEIKDIENRVRRRDLMIEEEEMLRFYRDRIPGIFDIRMLKKAIEKRGSDDFLKMDRESLLRYLPGREELALYPDAVSLGKSEFSLEYRFDPGNAEDGVTVKIPVSAASAIPPDAVDWGIPGLLKEKAAAMIRALSKNYRKRLVPIADTADTIAKEMPKTEEPLANALSRFIYRRFGVDIPASAWSLKDVPEHLAMRIALTDLAGEEVEASRDKSVLTRAVAAGARTPELPEAMNRWKKSGVCDWNFGDLPESIEIGGKDGLRWAYYPGLEKTGDGVNLRLFEHRSEALRSHKRGVAGLYSIALSKDLRFLKRSLALPTGMKTAAMHFGGIRAVEDRIYESLLSDLFSIDIRSRAAFYARAEEARPLLFEKGKEKSERVAAVLNAHHDARTALSRLESASIGNPAAGGTVGGVKTYLSRIKDELQKLVPENFIELYSAEKLYHLVRYIGAIVIRARRGLADMEKDQVRESRLKRYTEKLESFLDGLSPSVSEEKRTEIENLFWLIEEYKVSLFAQELGTARPVSEKRLEAKIGEINRMV